MFIHKLISAIKLSSELKFVLMILTTPPHQSLLERKTKTKAIKSNIENINKKCLTKTYGERRLDKSAATLWNSFPQNIRHVQSVSIVKKLLKTHLYRAAYCDSI